MNSQNTNNSSSSSSLFAHRTMPEILSQPPIESSSQSPASTLSLPDFEEVPSCVNGGEEQEEINCLVGLQKHLLRLLEKVEKLESENRRLCSEVEGLKEANAKHEKCISDLKIEIDSLLRNDANYSHKKRCSTMK